METAEHREPCESRGSRTDLGAPGGEIPPGDSTITTFHGDSKFGRFWSEADIELRLSSGLTAQKPTAMTITIKNQKSAHLDRYHAW